MKYFRLPQSGEKRQKSTTTRQGTRLSYFSIGILCLIVTYLGYWAIRRIAIDIRENTSNGEKDLIISSYSTQDLSWLDQVPTAWTIKRYITDDPTPAAGLSLPRSFGREAMTYLTYIIGHYDSLPDYAVFIHGHYQSWHQQAPISAKIRALNLTALKSEGYISLRCGNNMGCERRPYLDTYNVNWEGEAHIREFWQSIVPVQELPRYISYKCCAQFAVSRATMRTRSREEWIQIRQPLMREVEEMARSEIWAKGVENLEWKLGSFYEKLWHLLFGMEPEYCPSQDKCNMVHFSNAIICAGDQDLTPYEYDLWKMNVCKTAFDGVERDQLVNWTDWNHNIISFSGDIRTERARVLGQQVDKLKHLEQSRPED